MALRSSCTTRLRSSVRSWSWRNKGPTWWISSTASSTSRGMTTKNTLDSRRLMVTDSTRAETSITGARTSRRIPMVTVICMAFTSLVRRVIREAVENFSILRKEKA